MISGTATTTLTAITTSVTRVSGSARAASRSTLRPLTASPSAAKTAAGTSSPRTASQSAAADWADVGRGRFQHPGSPCTVGCGRVTRNLL